MGYLPVPYIGKADLKDSTLHCHMKVLYTAKSLSLSLCACVCVCAYPMGALKISEIA